MSGLGQRKRRLDLVVAPEQAAAQSPRKRLRRAGFVMMWLWKARRGGGPAARRHTVDQLLPLVRQMQAEMYKLLLLLTVVAVRLSTVEGMLRDIPRAIDSLLAPRFDALQRSFKEAVGNIRHDQVEFIRLAPQKETPEVQAGPSTVVNQSHRQNMTKGVPETEGHTRMIKLCFADNERPKDPVFTRTPVEWQNGATTKVAIFENGNKITQGNLSELQIEIIPVRDDFFTKQGRANFSKEEFNKHIYTFRGKETVLLTTELRNGEACLGPIFFTESTHGEKIRLAARVKNQDLTIRVQEAITGPFAVQVHRNKCNEKRFPPSKEDDVRHLKNISPTGECRKNLAGKGITKVKHLMRYYHRDESSLQELTGLKKEMWDAVIKHAITADPGNEIYSYIVGEHNCVLFFNDFFVLVGVIFDGPYVPYNNLNEFQQHRVNQWKAFAIGKLEEMEKSGSLIPDYTIINGLPTPNHDTGPSIQIRARWPQSSDDRTANQEIGRTQFNLQNNAGPSTQATLPLQEQYAGKQIFHEGFGLQDPSMQQDVFSCYPPQGNFNGQGSSSAQSIPPDNTAQVQYNGSIMGANVNFHYDRNLSSCTTDAPGTCPATDGITQQTSSFENMPGIVDALPPIEGWAGRVADQALLSGYSELWSPEYQFGSSEFDDGNRDRL